MTGRTLQYRPRGRPRKVGEVGSDSGVRYLSYLIWPNVKIDHSSVNTIRVVSILKKRLKVSAEFEGRIILSFGLNAKENQGILLDMCNAKTGQ